MAKNFMQNGKWIDNPNAVVIILCKCGNKYIKTRDKQEVCLRCLSKLKKV